ncbi:MAG: aspartyl protease family protein [Alphaproteobacteria bacterium]|nr:aspartyl protease family protein [Alphaproteobacteria bacterium]MBU2380835.1 aspartyl protease family protein [Alphaproteobacteria bacterium]
MVEDRSRSGLDRRLMMGGALGLAALGPDAPRAQDFERGVRSDSGGRLTTPVTIKDRTLRFAVDSAANASVLASDLLEPLGLRSAGTAEMNTLIALERTPVVRVPRLVAGAVSREDLRMMIADRQGLGGVDGLLGADVLAGARLVMQFERRRMMISRSRTSGGYFFTHGRAGLRYRAPAEQRFINLMIIEGQAGRTAFRGILDTGAQVSIINTAMARATGAAPITLDNGRRTQLVQSPTGLGQEAEAMMLPIMGFGGVSIRRIPVLVGDFHTFDLWGVADQPAMLIGVDVLGRFDTVTIDLRRSEVIFQT